MYRFFVMMVFQDFMLYYRFEQVFSWIGVVWIFCGIDFDSGDLVVVKFLMFGVMYCVVDV